MPAGHGIQELVDAAYQREVLDHWQERDWEFAVSTDMGRQLRQEIEALPAEAWKLWNIDQEGVVREWAKVPYVPSRKAEKRDARPYRYLAIRIRR